MLPQAGFAAAVDPGKRVSQEPACAEEDRGRLEVEDLVQWRKEVVTRQKEEKGGEEVKSASGKMRWRKKNVDEVS